MSLTPGTDLQRAFARYDGTRDFSLKQFKSACYAPFLTLDFFTTGQVQVCCENDAFPVGHVQTDSLMDIWRGPRIQQLRDALRRYDFSHGCQGCEWIVQRGGRPYAMNYDMHRVETADAWPRVMQFRLSNVCNFACIMCDGILSSTIRRDRDKKSPLPRVYTDKFFDDLWNFLPHLDSIVFAGGEPLLIQEHFRIFDRLLQSQNQNACVSICTNGSILNEKIVGYLARLNVVHFMISIDGASKETFERIRIGSHFETVMGNLPRFVELTKHVRPRGRYGTKPAQLSFSFCLMPMNAHEMPDIFLMAEAWGADVFVNVVTFPMQCSFASCSPTDIRRVAQQLAEAYEEIRGRLSTVNQERYRVALSTLSGIAEDATSSRYAVVNTGLVPAGP